jgi:hypothetical protein
MSFCGSLPIAKAFIKHTQNSQIKTSNNFFLKQEFIGNGLNPQAFAKQYIPLILLRMYAIQNLTANKNILYAKLTGGIPLPYRKREY